MIYDSGWVSLEHLVILWYPTYPESITYHRQSRMCWVPIHSLALSLSHALTLSRSHSLTLSLSHSLTLTLSLSHACTLLLTLSLTLADGPTSPVHPPPQTLNQDVRTNLVQESVCEREKVCARERRCVCVCECVRDRETVCECVGGREKRERTWYKILGTSSSSTCQPSIFSSVNLFVIPSNHQSIY